MPARPAVARCPAVVVRTVPDTAVPFTVGAAVAVWTAPSCVPPSCTSAVSADAYGRWVIAAAAPLPCLIDLLAYAKCRFDRTSVPEEPCVPFDTTTAAGLPKCGKSSRYCV